MDEIVPKLWIGDLVSALDTETLKRNGISSVLTAMRGTVTINDTLMRHQILLDDTLDADILVHLPPSIQFIEKELEKGRGVLVHCQAGVSRSATIVAAYLMYSRDISADEALEIIREKRPIVEPNENFLHQLEVFYTSKGNISRRSKPVRMFYMERAMQEIMNGDGSQLETDMFAKFPRTPSDSVPSTPIMPRRRIRCKMCRQELATREHMIDHGQLGPPTPAALTPAGSRRPSSNLQPLTQIASNTPTHPEGQRTVGSLAMTSVDVNGAGETVISQSDYAVEDDARDDNGEQDTPNPNRTPQPGRALSSTGARPPAAVAPQDKLTSQGISRVDSSHPLSQASSQYATSADLSAALMANPKLAALRSPHISPAPAAPASIAPLPSITPISPPILINPKCSGYFVEPVGLPLLSSSSLLVLMCCV
ncbi:hypothetical protein AX16_010796 [Volvariella volvacea WC 439]|nr:hypothetical protein AX16_010796 [Volvariella volvacea WC 439]